MNHKLPSSKMALSLLSDCGCEEKVVSHCKAVSDLAVKFAKTCQKKGQIVNIDLVEIGALLHDLGRSQTHDVNHAVVGAEIAMSLNLPESIIQIVERHIGGGISAEEANKLGLPKKDYFPLTLEEKIVTYADKLIHASKVVPIEQTVQQYSYKLGENHPAIARILRLHDELILLIGDFDADNNNT